MKGAAADFLRFAPDIHRVTKSVNQIPTLNTMYGAAPAIQPLYLVPGGTRTQAVNAAERSPLAAFLWMVRSRSGSPRQPYIPFMTVVVRLAIIASDMMPWKQASWATLA